ncbi:MAG: hypothetical protein IKH57_00740 [Clostridia bacterium]|nr:hypothetical protein [Clostridia bacterium]
MKIIIETGCRAELAGLAEGLNELMADLEDIRDEVQDQVDEQDSAEKRADIERMDKALKLLSEAADLLDDGEK